MKAPKQVRKDLGWKLEELKEQHGMAGSYISQIENGKVIPHKENRERIEAIYGQRVNWMDVPFYPKDNWNGDWYDVESGFRTLVNQINGLPKDEKGIFIETAIKKLRTIFEKY